VRAIVSSGVSSKPLGSLLRESSTRTSQTVYSFGGITLTLRPHLSYLKIFRLSSALTTSLSTPAFFRRLSDALSTKSKAVAKLNLLRITRVACEHHPDRATLVARFSLASIVDRLAKQDEAILVRELAKEIYPTLLFGGDISSSFEEGGTVGTSGLGTRMGSGLAGSGEVEGRMGLVGKRISSMRRTTSESVVDVGSYRERQAQAQSQSHTREGTQGKEREAKLRQTVGRASGVSASVSASASTSTTASSNISLASTSGSGGNGSVHAPTYTPIRGEERERPKHKRRISRSQLRWVTHSST
jgi:hypothetical protein